MTMMEIIVVAIATVLALIFGAFHLGKSQGKGIATAEAETQNAENTAAGNAAVAERRVEVTKGASDVQQTVSHMSDDDVDRELRGSFTRKT
ncbi:MULTISPECIES: hypothetical protein [Klebsiella/Raoultella group]|uniref:hypothetical protein n=1 Tax=Klebsiella/Raoultella group TaxID=2890311 RepID=UPI000665C1A4|nr:MULTISPECIES: hypothetical protein [Klebsiella/Raoultella group]KAB8157397.1 hypothetical protein FNV36_17135 [Raoultella ornithinolytica]KAB8166586.1 hypothetical protein FNV35_15395 [Raoultella ornithinolytica]HBP37064.1 hypothetical protein [Raoultella ornithinolytica]HCH7896249.1 hypothetical protein [Raoultella ornithinolytica]